MIILGIESTAHSLGIGVVSHGSGKVNARNTKVLSSTIAKVPSGRTGFIPRKLAEHHAQKFKKTLGEALAKASVKAAELDAIAYAQGPGLGHCLHVGFAAANSLSLLLEKPLVPVNHTVAHVEVGKWACGMNDPLAVYVSGGNTQITALEGAPPSRHYRVYGETLDVGIGNFLDNAGRLLGVTPPDAVGIMKTAAEWRGDLIELPYSVKGVDLAFSGMLNAVRKATERGADKRQLCYSVQETSFAMLVEATERCLCHTRKKQVLAVGGVAQNARLAEMLGLMCKDQRVSFALVPAQYAGDNGAMIALTGLQEIISRGVPEDCRPDQNLRIDKTTVTW